MNAFPPVNYTQVPNILFDVMLRDMGDAELRVTLAAVRKIIGFDDKRVANRDAISLSQFQDMTGLSRPGVLKGLKKAKERGTVRECDQRGKRGIKLYTLAFQTPDQSTTFTSQQTDQSTPLTSSSQPALPVLVNEVNTQKKLSKETPSKKKDSSADAQAPASNAAIKSSRKTLSQAGKRITDKPSKPKPDTIPADRMNPMKNALALTMNYVPADDPGSREAWQQITKSEQGRICKAAKELCMVGANPDDIPKVAAYIHGKWGAAAVTVTSIPSHYNGWKAAQRVDPPRPPTQNQPPPVKPNPHLALTEAIMRELGDTPPPAYMPDKPDVTRIDKWKLLGKRLWASNLAKERAQS